MDIVSPYLLAVALAWVGAQGLKYVFAVLKTKKIGSFRQLYVSGNMPSAHSASVVALATVVGLIEGTGSAIFGLSALFAAVVMYDAVMVRSLCSAWRAVLDGTDPASVEMPAEIEGSWYSAFQASAKEGQQ